MFAAMAGLVVSVLALVFVLLYRYPLLGAALVFCTFFAESLVAELPPLSLGPISTYPQYLVFVALAMVGSARLILGRLAGDGRFAPIELWYLAFGLLILISFVRGALEYGAGDAGLDFREYFYFFAGALYFLTFPIEPSSLKKLTLMWLSAAGALVLLAAFRWATGAVVPLTEVQLAESGETRVLTAAQTLFIAQAVIMSLYLGLVRISPRPWHYLAIIFLPVLLLLQHRTVWIVVFVFLIVIGLRESRLRSKLGLILAAGLVSGTVVLLTPFSGETGTLLSSLESSASRTGTFEWRVESWVALLTSDRLDTYTNFLLGEPFGAGYRRYLPGIDLEYVDVSPHNFYVQTLLRTGLLGTIVLVSTYAFLLLRLRSFVPNGEVGYLDRQQIFVLLLTQLIFFITYAPHFEQGIFLGLAIGLARYASSHETVHKGRRVRITWRSTAQPS